MFRQCFPYRSGKTRHHMRTLVTAQCTYITSTCAVLYQLPLTVGNVTLKAVVHWVRVNAFSAESSPKLTWDAMGLRADSAHRLSVRAEPLTR